MRWRELIREAWKDAQTQKIPSLLLLLVTLGACLAALLTAGQQEAQKAVLAQKLQDPASRMLVIREKKGLITPEVLALAQATRGVEIAVGVVKVDDVEPTVPGLRVPAWTVSNVEAIYASSLGRAPETGEALIQTGEAAEYGWEVPAGVFTDRDGQEFPVVGEGAPRPGFASFANGVLIQADPYPAAYQSLHVLASSLEVLPDVQTALLSYISAQGGAEISVENAGMQIVSELTGGEYARYGQSILLTVLVAGGFLTAVVTLTYVLLYRRILGRRRALGITRFDLALLTLLRIAIPISIGAAIGALVAYTYAATRLATIPLDYTVASALILVIISVLAAIAPIAWAVNRDPARIMRTP
ncbi:ABC transporter permease [Actinobaculum suis]|uniref:ABC transporter permease n=1 Tax=Actinobaculum suis TaxID=1657 RepID=UPI00066FB85F|nr:ABC transporter permease [Actinobaculum suis]KMY22808.1 hypothetical protein ACU19_08100 [Actinobaculum suis]OCA93113.1 hypothetical protein ACU21_01295 [Actinobaculum suis]OCA93245.1 hypothetical protein ACU20_02495 [Actinobaculum suis]